MAFDTETLGQALVDQNAITPEKLQQALEESERTGNPLETALVDMDFLSHEQIHEAIAAAFGMQLITLDLKKLSEDVLDLVAPSAAELHRAIPCERQPDGSVIVAVADLENLSVIDDLRYTLNVDVQGALTTDEQIETILEEYYRKKSESIDELINDLAELKPEELSDDEAAASVGTGPVVKLLELVLVQAVKDGASDVHFEPFEDVYKIRYRVDGSLYELVPPPLHLAPALSSRIKVMSGLKIAERRLPQDGRITARIAGRAIDLRVSTLPTMFGESVVVRILDREAVKLDLNKLGLEQDVRDKMKEIILRPNGIVLVTGPTGCGKTTTLYGCLTLLNDIESKVITTEDPVEYDIEGVVQVPINENVGLTYAKSLRSILRQDPDRIMVGEIRDLETTQIAIQASLTGHIVLSTLHTNDAPTTITRLIDMGTEPFLIGSTMQCVVAQRLVRKICEHCKEEYTPTDEDKKRLVNDLSLLEGITFHKGNGCAHCNNSGYRGRTGIFEMLVVTEPIRELINDRAPAVALREKAREEGMRVLREDGILKISRGITTLDEVIRNTIGID
jgi:type IV pilus assembly protein PilB